MTNQQQLYILLPVHNRQKITVALVHLLLKQSFQQFQIVLIDDGSTDHTADEVKKLAPSTVVIRGTGNWWWGGSLQQGYNWIKKQVKDPQAHVLILNDDSHFDTFFLQKGIESLNKYTRTFVSAYREDVHGKSNEGDLHFNFKTNICKKAEPGEPVNCLPTRALFMKANDFISTGGFRPFFLPHYLSDYEFTIRAYRKGIALKCEPGLKVYYNPDTTGIIAFTDDSWKQFRKVYWSKKYLPNPLYFFNFYILAFPFPYKLKYAWGSVRKALRDTLGMFGRMVLKKRRN